MLLRPEDALWSGSGPLLEDMDEILYSSLHSDDIWKKFEFLDIPAAEFTPSSVANIPDQMDKALDHLLEWSLDATTKEKANEIRHHDCMWAGHCGSKEHKPETAKIPTPQQKAQPDVIKESIIVKKTVVVPVISSSRSLLRNRPAQETTVVHSTVPNPQLPVGPRPDSPPSSDDDDHPRFKHEITGIFDQTVNKTLQLLNDAISECDFEDDSDLCEYFEDSDVFAGTDSSEGPRSYPGESDHSYHKGKGAQLRMDHLGVQTPSDSGKFYCFFITFQNEIFVERIIIMPNA